MSMGDTSGAPDLAVVRVVQLTPSSLVYVEPSASLPLLYGGLAVTVHGGC